MTDTSYADALILFGITGDLARRKLFSALYDLTAAGHLDMRVVGVASRGWDDETLRQKAREALEASGRPIDEKVFARLAANLSYVSGNYREPGTYQAIREKVIGQRPRRILSRHPPGPVSKMSSRVWPRWASITAGAWCWRNRLVATHSRPPS